MPLSWQVMKTQWKTSWSNPKVTHERSYSCLTDGRGCFVKKSLRILAQSDWPKGKKNFGLLPTHPLWKGKSLAEAGGFPWSQNSPLTSQCVGQSYKERLRMAPAGQPWHSPFHQVLHTHYPHSPKGVTASYLHMSKKRLDSYGQGSIWNTGLLIPQLMFLFHFPSPYKCIYSSWRNCAKYRKTWNEEIQPHCYHSQVSTIYMLLHFSTYIYLWSL